MEVSSVSGGTSAAVYEPRLERRPDHAEPEAGESEGRHQEPQPRLAGRATGGEDQPGRHTDDEGRERHRLRRHSPRRQRIGDAREVAPHVPAHQKLTLSQKTTRASANNP
ncbi:MAG TPA: hypothetical protein VEU29_02200 [Actinomycetota bacterium]|nr:hypothetical protein [Actinomycetota bacterium]